MTLLYPNPCYNEVCYKGTALYYNRRDSHNEMDYIKTIYALDTKIP